MLAGSLFLLLLGLIFQVVVPMSQGTVRGAQQVELQQVAATALNRLVRDLEAAAPSGITIAPGASFRLAVHRLVDVGADGSQVYGGDLVVYWWTAAEGRLRRKTWPPPALARPLLTSAIFIPTASELDQIVGSSNGTERVVAAQTREFSVSLGNAGATTHMLLEAPAPDGKPAERYELNRTTYLPNQQY